MAISLTGKAAIVTGAGRGIGKGIAQVFAQEGAKVLVVNRGEAAGRECAEAIARAGGEASFFQADVSKKAELEAMAQAAVERLGGIDVLCLNAGIYPSAKIAEMSEETWDEVQNTNLKGVFLATQACLPQMIAQNGGRIVVTSSITGSLVGWPGLVSYMASKGGLDAFVRGAALEFAQYNITVNGVAPGTIMTEGLKELGGEKLEEIAKIIPAGYIGEPEDIAYAMVYFASDQARFVTGQTLVLDGGQILPENPSAMEDA